VLRCEQRHDQIPSKCHGENQDSGSSLPPLVPLLRNQKAFIEKVVNTRNFYTHYDLALEDKVAREEELYRLTQIPVFLLEACFLNELGFSPQQSVELFQKNSDHRNVLSLSWLLPSSVC
jgi:hypothetical protein